MLNHIALSVTESDEIENFYEKVLIFRTKHKFALDSLLVRKIFDVNSCVDVCVLERNGLEFEIFINTRQENKFFSHICLSYQSPEIIYENALKSGYKTLVKDGSNHFTYFIWDKSRNMFEIKNLRT